MKNKLFVLIGLLIISSIIKSSYYAGELQLLRNERIDCLIRGLVIPYVDNSGLLSQQRRSLTQDEIGFVRLAHQIYQTERIYDTERAQALKIILGVLNPCLPQG